MDAIQMDVDDIRRKFGSEYDDKIKHTIDYAKQLNLKSFIPDDK